jgi:drug/metabolite transporter (DMT)-like permease
MRVSKIPFASSSSRIVSFLVLATWIAIVGSWSCQNVVAFAFTKIPNSLLDDRHPHQDRRHRHRNQPTTISTKASNRNNHGNINNINNKKKALSSVLLSATTEGREGSDDATSVTKGRLLLGLVAILYGSLNVLLRFVYDVPDVPPTAAALSATRGWLAFLCFLPPLLLDQRNSKPQNDNAKKTDSKQKGDIFPLFFSGLELATWGFLAQGLLNVGLVSTGSARASFLTQTSVLFTPLISTLIGKQSVSKNVWLACLVALAGLVVLTMGAGGGVAAGASAFALSLSRGDLFVVGGALSWSMYLFRISYLGPKHPELVLQGLKTGLMAIIYSIWWMATTAMNLPSGGGGGLSFLSIPSWMTSSYIVWIALFFSAIGPGMIADVLQQKAQKDVSPSEANILLSAEPVFATIFAVLLLGENSSLLEMIGGALILIAAVVASV